MKNKMVFEQLAQELPEDERKNMLKEIKKSPIASKEPDQNKRNDFVLNRNENILIETEIYSENKKKIKNAKESLSFYQKIMFFFNRFISNKSIENLLEEYLLKKEAEKVEIESPDLIDFKNQKLKEKFLTKISSLSNDIEIFSQPINYILKENKIDLFYRYIIQKEVPIFEETILRDVNPENIYESELPENLDIIKPTVIKIFNEKINSFEKEEKAAIIEHLKAFCYMEKLVTFPFESFKYLFLSDINNHNTCHFIKAKKPLAKLDTILSKLATEFSKLDTLAEYLFGFYDTSTAPTESLKNGNNTPNNDTLKEVSPAEKKKASNALASIQNFYTSLPFNHLLRVITINLSYKTASLICRVDWFTAYKKLLKKEIEDQTDEYVFLEKKKRLIKQLREYIKEISLAENDDMTLISERAQYNLRNCNILYYLYIVFEKFYTENLEEIFSKIIIDGNFYKDSNKKELIEAFTVLKTFKKKYIAFSKKMGVGSISYINKEKITGKKEKAIIKSISAEGYRLYKNYFESFISISNILKGIISGSGTEKYDTLSNLNNLFGVGGIIPANLLNKFSKEFNEIIAILNEYNFLIASREYDW